MPYQCDNCKDLFDSTTKLSAHQKRRCKSKICADCGSKFRRHRDLLRHRNNRKNIECTHCSRKFCSNDHFEKHLRTIKEVSDDPVDLDRPIQPSTGYESEDGYQAVLKAKANDIEDKEVISENHKVINREIEPSFTYSDLEKLITNIYAAQSNAFKIDIAFGSILYNTTTNEFRYFYNSDNRILFEKAITISDKQDVDKLMKRIVNLDLSNAYYLQKPSSAWTMAGLTNVQIDIYDLKHTPIGTPPKEFPDFIKNSKSMYSLINEKGHNKPYNDNLCFFRCLAIHQLGKNSGLERETKKLLQQAMDRTGRNFKKGVSINHIPALEVLFSVAINIYSLNEDGSAEVIYLSRLSYREEESPTQVK